MEYQPRFQAFLKSKGKSHHTEVRVREFPIWIGENVREFRKMNGISEWEPLTEKQQLEFTEFLFNKQ